jgi:hypothetical protein
VLDSHPLVMSIKKRPSSQDEGRFLYKLRFKNSYHGCTARGILKCKGRYSEWKVLLTYRLTSRSNAVLLIAAWRDARVGAEVARKMALVVEAGFQGYLN